MASLYDKPWWDQVQRTAEETTASSSWRPLLQHVRCIAEHLPSSEPRVVVDARALHVAIAAVEKARPLVRPEYHRRLYQAANLAWYHAHAAIPAPLVAPRLPPGPLRSVVAPPRVLTRPEAQRLCHAAESVSVRCGLFVRLLLSSGVRIGAVPGLMWSQIIAPSDNDDEDPKTHTCVVVREKGNQPRVLWLDESLRTRLAALYRDTPPAERGVYLFGRPPTRRLPMSSRQLRNWWYAACDRAKLTGEGLHPHVARHFVAHELFRSGNALSVIAKFLGHASVDTTHRYYLRLSFQEIMDRVKLPPPLL